MIKVSVGCRLATELLLLFCPRYYPDQDLVLMEVCNKVGRIMLNSWVPARCHLYAAWLHVLTNCF